MLVQNQQGGYAQEMLSHVMVCLMMEDQKAVQPHTATRGGAGQSAL